VCCLQELLITDTYTFGNRLYSFLSAFLPHSLGRPTGGVGILVRKVVLHSRISLTTPLQAVACRISTPRPLTVCSIYNLPPASQFVGSSGFMALVAQLPSPALQLDDFNAHHTLWAATESTLWEKRSLISYSPATCVFLATNVIQNFTLPQVLAVPSTWTSVTQRCTWITTPQYIRILAAAVTSRDTESCLPKSRLAYSGGSSAGRIGTLFNERNVRQGATL
jgi:hypothetical protein